MICTILIIGGGQAGAQAIDTLRREGFGGRLVLIGDEPELPYQRPPLSKKYLSGEMAAAYFIDHFPHSFLPIKNEGDLAVSLCFAFLYLSFAGGGAWSLDTAMGKES